MVDEVHLKDKKVTKNRQTVQVGKQKLYEGLEALQVGMIH